jgi:hypothetical protein
MVCKPNFHIEVLKGGYKLAFNCAMSHDDGMDEEGEENVQQTAEGEQYRMSLDLHSWNSMSASPYYFALVAGDQFNIEEFSIYKGEFKDNAYVISGEIMDGVS